MEVQMVSQTKKQKAFVLPSTIFSIVFISFFLTLIFTLNVSATLETQLFKNQAELKIQCEKIFYDFKNDIINEYEGIEIQEYDCNEFSSISAIIATKNQKVICFGIYDFGDEVNQPATICYQTSNFAYEIQEDGKLNYDDLTFNLVEETI